MEMDSGALHNMLEDFKESKRKGRVQAFFNDVIEDVKCTPLLYMETYRVSHQGAQANIHVKYDSEWISYVRVRTEHKMIDFARPSFDIDKTLYEFAEGMVTYAKKNGMSK